MPVIDPGRYGVSFSVKQCHNFGIDPMETLSWLTEQGWRRFRLMSYWNEHEPHPGIYDFASLDAQVKHIAKAGGIITLCLGVKQPRWPEYHWPKWTKTVSAAERNKALLHYIETVVNRYKHHGCIQSYQLENEALLRGFGKDIDINRDRLVLEYQRVRLADSTRPVYMSTSNGWGIPVRQPRPASIGFSYYSVMHQGGKYRRTIQKPWLHRLRAAIIRVFLRRPVFIHELQCEPWGPTAIWKMPVAMQDESMGVAQIKRNMADARKIGRYPIDLWGAEWWYWRAAKQGDPSIWQAIQQNLE